ncbi:hypothetical protein [Paracoccus sp. SCSIO 75233]|uniref:hypothetical protein n=1 Tax=Paracoccus sp. SCSIO 75233 TaxID=3017782 RepID=UPI0022F0BE77|nr:hypothetical protein [Paracoccus sp. SCSIO 75233]WBU54709.1 hypothetical protein PAF12_07755 [Paracoccus sp. SCSIO 75233]
MSEQALTDDAQASRRENALAVRIFLGILVVLVVAVLIVVLFGLPALGLIGLILTALCFAVMLAFMAGS